VTIADRPHGSRSRYNAGCRCDTCRQANRRYAQHYRRSRKLRAVPEPQASTPRSAEQTLPAPGVVTAAVVAQLADLPAAEARPGIAAIAVRLAELLDNAEATPQHPAAAGRLVELLCQLAKAEPSRRGRLSLVRSMTSGPAD
jgi:hypothetical protein